MEVLLCLIWAASTLGTICFVRRAFRLPAAFCPAAALAGQVLCLYLLALADLLKLGVYGVTAFGLAALVWCVQRSQSFWRELLEPAFVFFLCYGLLLAVVNRQMVLLEFDNYTHWAVIAKELFRTNTLPGQGTMVLYTNYPPAAALYEYYVLQFLGLGERQMALAMNLLGGAMLSCCLVNARWSQWRNLLFRLVLLFGVFWVVPGHYRALLVDALLGFILLAMGAMALWDDDFSKGTAVPQAMLGALLILTKMSGAMLLLLHAGLLLLLKYRGERPAIRRYLLALAGSGAAAWLSFRVHLIRTFGGADVGNQFQLSLSNFAQKLQEKSAAFWDSFPRAFFGELTSRELACGRFFLLVELLLGVLFLLTLFRVIQLPERARGVIVFSWGCTAFYLLCLAAMYIFLMGEYEGSLAAAFDRYFGTVMIYQLGLPFTSILLEGDDGMFTSRPAPVWLCQLGVFLGVLVLAARLELFPAPWKAGYQANQSEANRKIFAAAEQVGDLLADGQLETLVSMNYTAMSPDLTFYTLRYAFWSGELLPLIQVYWDENYYSGEKDPCYILWLESYEWLETVLPEQGIPVPEQPGLYYKDRNNDLTLVREIAYPG